MSDPGQVLTAQYSPSPYISAKMQQLAEEIEKDIAHTVGKLPAGAMVVVVGKVIEQFGISISKMGEELNDTTPH